MIFHSFLYVYQMVSHDKPTNTGDMTGDMLQRRKRGLNYQIWGIASRQVAEWNRAEHPEVDASSFDHISPC